ncbi:MAG: type II toxin-antitoxin system VapC family toxin [Moorea sp. SIO2B7]|nr:type II toxin-antitoxin system VapC family toxin [Moorena sp. SIO2B7]
MVKVLFDTSVLVAAFVRVHPKHISCTEWWQKVTTGEIKGIISNHTLAELYSVITSLPIQHRFSPTLAQQVITGSFKGFEAISLTTKEYRSVIRQVGKLNLTGAAIYDALIAKVFIKSNSDYLLTNNPDNFTRISEEIAQKIKIPQ